MSTVVSFGETSATGPSSSIAIDGVAVGSGVAHEVAVSDGATIAVDVDSADGTASARPAGRVG